MIAFRQTAATGSGTHEWIGRDMQGNDLVKIVPGVEGTIWDGRPGVIVPGFEIQDMSGMRLDWHFHWGLAECAAADHARRIRDARRQERKAA